MAGYTAYTNADEYSAAVRMTSVRRPMGAIRCATALRPLKLCA